MNYLPPRNPLIMAQGKFNELSKRVGHRAIYIPSMRCPISDCVAGEQSNALCDKCGQIANAQKRVYTEAKQVEHSHSLVKDPAYESGVRETLEHRWLTSEPVIMDKAGNEFKYLVDFEVKDRTVVWKTAGPKKWSDYTVAYKAYSEDNLYQIHASAKSVGGMNLAAQSTVLAPALIPQGSVGLSIPPEADSYLLHPGDLFVMADWVYRDDQAIDITMPRRKAKHKWITRIFSAYYYEKVDGKMEARDCMEFVSYDFENSSWIIRDEDVLIDAGVETIAINYEAAQIFIVNMDFSEIRAPHFGHQPRLVVAKKYEITI
jgi:hypothetical protein